MSNLLTGYQYVMNTLKQNFPNVDENIIDPKKIPKEDLKYIFPNDYKVWVEKYIKNDDIKEYWKIYME